MAEVKITGEIDNQATYAYPIDPKVIKQLEDLKTDMTTTVLTFEKATVRDCNMRSFVPLFVSMLKLNRSITTINICGYTNIFYGEDVENALIENKTIRNINDQRGNAADWAKFLKTTTSLQSLILTNRTGVSFRLSQIFSSNKSLVHLKARIHSDIESVLSFCEVLRYNKTLTSVDLSGTPFYIYMMRPLADVLRTNETVLQSLNLSETRIEDIDLLILIDALKANRTISFLNLSKNAFTKASMPLVIDMMMYNTKIQGLAIEFEDATQEEMAKFTGELEAYIHRNRMIAQKN